MGKLIAIWILECIVNLYDIVTLPIYYLIQQPWKQEQLATQTRAIKVNEHTWTSVNTKRLDESKTALTLDQLFDDSVSTYAEKKCLGIRKVLAVQFKEEDDNENKVNQNKDKSGAPKENGLPSKTQENKKSPVKDGDIAKKKPNKRQIKNFVLDDEYTWYTYKEIGETVIKLSAGLTNLCQDSIINSDGSRKLLICADTCMQWFLTAHACFRNNITVVTAYTTLDDDAIVTTLLETEVKIFVTTQAFAQRLSKILNLAPLVDTLILLDEAKPGMEDERENLKPLITNGNIKRLISYNDIVARGSVLEEKVTNRPTKDDVAVLMYTSGSTGKAKGVMLTHNNIVYTARSFSGPGDIGQNDRYIGFLPLGHVLELAAECIFLRCGSTIAYSTPLTLTDKSPMVKPGQKGDLSLYRPTVMGAVPLVLDRVKNALVQAVKSQGTFYDQLINDFVIRYKRYWWERYYDAPIMNWLICRKFKAILGGEMRAICCGGAALSKETQEYLRHVTNTTIVQGYGLTETSAAASFSYIYDRRYNTVGPPYPSIHLTLESWSDYSVDDKPYPRGEIIIAGPSVSIGYYKMPELTKEHFFTDPKTGLRSFRSGDIGLMLPDGVLKVIDRKKDIVKPLSGEYISLSAIENALNGEPIVENMCVYCSQYSNYIVAIVRPNAKELRALACRLFRNNKSDVVEQFRKSIQKLYSIDHPQEDDTCTKLSSHIKMSNGHGNGLMNGNSIDEDINHLIDQIDFASLCSNRYIAQACVDILKEAGMRNKLKRHQIPSKVKLASEDWTQESGFVTPSFKLRRRDIERYYGEDIKQLYAELGQKIDQN